MAKQGEAAYAYFLKGYNCSQSVVAAFAPQLGLSEEMALRLSAGSTPTLPTRRTNPGCMPSCRR